MESSDGDARKDVAVEGVLDVEQNQAIGTKFLDIEPAQRANAPQAEEKLRRRALPGTQPGPG